MGREVRMVPKDWQHPRDESGEYIPMVDQTYEDACAEWWRDAVAWHNGTHEAIKEDPEQREKYPWFWLWSCNPPDETHYRPAYEGPCTHYQMYENTTEGKPISPPMETPEKLARWLADNKASALGWSTATYEQWLATIKLGSSMSMAMVGGRLMSGVEFNALEGGPSAARGEELKAGEL